MAWRGTSWLSRPNVMRNLWMHARLAIRLVREPRVPWLIKALPFLAVLYVISPLDFLPDTLPLFGELDDLMIVFVALEIFLRLCPTGPKAFHREAIAKGRPFARMGPTDGFIDAEWRRG